MRRILGLLAVIVLMNGSSAFGQQGPPTVDDVIAAFTSRETRMFEAGRFSIDYASVKCDAAVKQAPHQIMTFESRIVRDQGNWYVSRRFTEPKRTKDVVVHGEPTIIIASKDFACEYRVGRRFGIQNFDQHTNLYFMLTYFSALHLDVYKYDYLSRGLDVKTVRSEYRNSADQPFLPEFLSTNRDRYTIKPGNSPSHWVLEWPGMDRIEVDATRNFCMTSRTIHWGEGQPLRSKWTYDDYREVKPGLWLPFRLNGVVYGHIKAEKTGYNKPYSEQCFVVSDIDFDPVDPSTFEVSIPAGTRVIDGVRDRQYVTASEHAGSPFADLTAIRSVKPTGVNRRLSILIVAGVLLAIAAVIVIVRYRRRVDVRFGS